MNFSDQSIVGPFITYDLTFHIDLYCMKYNVQYGNCHFLLEAVTWGPAQLPVLQYN